MNRLTFFLLFIVGLTSCHKESATNLIYQSNFDSDNNTWYKGCNSGLCCQFSQGTYQMKVIQASSLYSVYVPNILLNGTFSMSVDVGIYLDDPTKWGDAGITFNRITSTNYMKLLVSTYGHYEIYHYVDGTMTKLVDWSYSSVINTGNGVTNTIKINQHEENVEFFINGTSIGSYSSNQYFNFKVGLSAGSGSDFTNVTASFDNLVITKL